MNMTDDLEKSLDNWYMDMRGRESIDVKGTVNNLLKQKYYAFVRQPFRFPSVLSYIKLKIPTYIA